MAFRFSLQSILRLRRSLENQEEKKLLAIVLSAAKVRAEIEHLDEIAVKQRRIQNEELAGGVALGAVLKFNSFCEERRRELRNQWTRKLVELEQMRLEQAANYRKAKQKRDILEGLRDHQKTEYERKTLQREQQRMDEAFLIRKIREDLE